MGIPGGRHGGKPGAQLSLNNEDKGGQLCGWAQYSGRLHAGVGEDEPATEDSRFCAEDKGARARCDISKMHENMDQVFCL